MKQIILASKSPRRQELIKGLDIPFTIKTYEVDESFPDDLRAGEIALYLANKKAACYPDELKKDEILITCDTIVWVNNHVLNKPENENMALEMLTELSGKFHQVYTGVCIKTSKESIAFFEETKVHIKPCLEVDLRYYIKTYQPFDKAGSYGIQDWFGYTAVEKIEGCFYNVMGLPVAKLFETLRPLLQ